MYPSPKSLSKEYIFSQCIQTHWKFYGLHPSLCNIFLETSLLQSSLDMLLSTLVSHLWYLEISLAYVLSWVSYFLDPVFSLILGISTGLPWEHMLALTKTSVGEKSEASHIWKGFCCSLLLIVILLGIKL